jgi:UDP-glucose 4-epimerase
MWLSAGDWRSAGGRDDEVRHDDAAMPGPHGVDQVDLGEFTMKVLVAGGAGFIGSTVTSALLDAGHVPVVLDSFVTGRREFGTGRIVYEGDIGDPDVLDTIFADHPDIELALHFAALIVVPESVARPLDYYRENVVKTLALVTGLLRHGCPRLVFSSSASIYRPSADGGVDEASPLDPTSPYARTKAMVEAMLADVAAATPLRVVSLRYFNPVGSDPELRTGLQVRTPSHALGQLITAHGSGGSFTVTGTDYPTRDGSGIRDYVHVWDLADAHVRAVERFDRLVGDEPATVLNLGTGEGTTVLELVAAFNRVVDTPVAVEHGPRRPGDTAGSFTRSDRARERLGWRPQRTLDDGIVDTLRWFAVRDEVLIGSFSRG